MEAKEITVRLHVESADGQPCWWADSPDVEGFSALAPTLHELRQRLMAAFDDLCGADRYRLRERLVGAHHEPGDPHVTTTDLVSV